MQLVRHALNNQLYWLLYTFKETACVQTYQIQEISGSPGNPNTAEGQRSGHKYYVKTCDLASVIFASPVPEVLAFVHEFKEGDVVEYAGIDNERLRRLGSVPMEIVAVGKKDIGCIAQGTTHRQFFYPWELSLMPANEAIAS